MVRLGWDNDWCAPPVHNDAIVLVLDNYLLTFPGFGDSPSCNGTPGGGPTPVRIGTFEPAKSIEAQLQTPYADLQVTGNLNLTSTPGTELKFTVTMTSPANLVLDPCPDYRIVLSGDDDTQDDLYALNCAALPYRNDRGQPYLPAGIPVSFDMRATPRTTPGEYKFTWLLDTVDQRGTSGDLTLEAPR